MDYYSLREIDAERHVLDATVEAMQSGLYHGYVGLVDGILKKMIDELGRAPRVIATGGLAPLIARGSRFIQEVDETLTLDQPPSFYSRLERLRGASTYNLHDPKHDADTARQPLDDCNPKTPAASSVSKPKTDSATTTSSTTTTTTTSPVPGS